MTVDAVILAAGYSSRAEGFKMQFEMENKAVIQHVIEAFLPICVNVFVVGGFQYEKLIPLIEPYGDQVKLIINNKFEQGMFTSVKAGVKQVTSQQFFITPGDYPLLTTHICSLILAAGKEYTVPSFQRKGGHPILLASSCIKELLLEDDDSNLKLYLKKKPVEYVDICDQGILYDLDTRQDYIKLQNLMKENADKGKCR
ncbi:MAG: NTP transferase domain-containing protein [Lachnotalea sp.]